MPSDFLSKICTALMLFFLIQSSVAIESKKDEQIVDFLFLQNEMSRKAIISVKYDIEWSVDINEKKRKSSAVGQSIHKGDFRWSSFQSDTVDILTEESRKSSGRLVINDRYVGILPGFENTIAYQHDIQSLNEISDQLKSKIIMSSALNVMNFGFGSGDETLSQAKENSPEGVKWSAMQGENEKGAKVYFLTRIASPNRKTVFIIDPRQGFLVTRATLSLVDNDSSNVWIDIKVTPQEIGDGLWFPVEVTKNIYGGVGKNHRIRTSLHGIVSNIHVNEEIDDKQFELESLGYDPDKQLIIREFMDGTVDQFVYTNGNLVSRKLQDDIKHLNDLSIEQTEVASIEKITDIKAKEKQKKNEAQLEPLNQPLEEKYNVWHKVSSKKAIAGLFAIFFGLGIIIVSYKYLKK